MTGLFFHSVGNFIIPIDELIFFRGVAQPLTGIRQKAYVLPLCKVSAYSRIVFSSSLMIHAIVIEDVAPKSLCGRSLQ